MAFLAPAFLVALAALAVPVLLHLIQRERHRVVEFPSLMFLRRIPYQSVRRRRIRHWLLLAMRLAVLLLLVLAFARPFIRGSDVSATAAAGPRELVILLDNSYSMGYGDRWSRARDAARRAIDGLASGDRASLVLFSTGAHLVVRSSADRGRLRASVDAAAPGSGATRYGPALKLAASTLAASQRPRREVLLVTDFQKVGWNPDAAARLPEGSVVTTVDVAGNDVTNLSVTPVSLERTRFSGQERVSVTAGVANRGGAAVTGVELALDVDGRPAATARVDVGARASASVTFPPFTLTSEQTRGTVRLSPDALAADNAFHFVVSPGRAVPVVVADRGGDRAESLYLLRALGIGIEPRFDVRAATAEHLGRDLPAGTVVILNGVVPSTGELARLRAAIDGGAGLLVVAGEHLEWPGNASDLLPARPGPVVDRSASRGGLLASIDFSHPAFDRFTAPRSGDFTAARFFRYRSAVMATGARELARFDDGAVALAEHRVGRGRVMLWSSTLDAYWNDLALKPLFLPFVHRVVRHLAQYVDAIPWRTVGQLVDPGAVAGDAASAGTRGAMALTPSGAHVQIGRGTGQVLELTEHGFYEIGAGERPKPLILATNVDLSESDLTRIDPGEMAAAIRGGIGGGQQGEAPVTAEDQERQSGLWWYLLLAALVLLAAEMVVSNRASPARP